MGYGRRFPPGLGLQFPLWQGAAGAGKKARQPLAPPLPQPHSSWCNLSYRNRTGDPRMRVPAGRQKTLTDFLTRRKRPRTPKILRNFRAVSSLAVLFLLPVCQLVAKTRFRRAGRRNRLNPSRGLFCQSAGARVCGSPVCFTLSCDQSYTSMAILGSSILAAVYHWAPVSTSATSSPLAAFTASSTAR